MAQTIRLRRGLESALPTTGLTIGEPLYTTDRYNVYVADSATSHKPLTPNLNDLVAITGAALTTANDLLMIHDADGTNQREKKITVAELKSALNIPAASTDELVAATVGGTADYLDAVVVGETDVISIASINAGEDLEWSIALGGIGTAKLADDAVTTAKLANTALNLSADFAGTGVDTALSLAANSVGSTEIAGLAVGTTKLADDAVTTAKLANSALNLNAVFSGTGVDTALTIATGGITNGMLAAGAVDVNTTTFTGNGTTTELDVAVIDGGPF